MYQQKEKQVVECWVECGLYEPKQTVHLAVPQKNRTRQTEALSNQAASGFEVLVGSDSLTDSVMIARRNCGLPSFRQHQKL